MAFEILHKTLYPNLERNILVQNNYVMYGIVLLYLFFVKLLGPNIMMKRKPLDLKIGIILFNSALVASNLYLSFNIIHHISLAWPHRCTLKQGKFLQNYYKEFGWVYWHLLLVKYAELFDTVFFVLRKKFNQISFLHVFHHSIVCLVATLILRSRQAGFSIILITWINSSVHVLTYLYYCLSAFGPEMRKYLWWKKYLTRIQIAQFITLLIYMFVGFITKCEDLGFQELSVFGLTIIIMALFFNFYYKAYKTKQPK